ncbi:hypothetical protein BB559_003746 [Furculomyces boomerangus]|uniref:Phosphodiesterase n=1 Tax=Furculomyces boomerangus TaxID=61424 RepID=A0A2T9YJ64_9FUNG|nr:hypothetical protein BB559_003746 [Furculomyces boomerangus]
MDTQNETVYLVVGNIPYNKLLDFPTNSPPSKKYALLEKTIMPDQRIDVSLVIDPKQPQHTKKVIIFKTPLSLFATLLFENEIFSNNINLLIGDDDFIAYKSKLTTLFINCNTDTDKINTIYVIEDKNKPPVIYPKENCHLSTDQNIIEQISTIFFESETERQIMNTVNGIPDNIIEENPSILEHTENDHSYSSPKYEKSFPVSNEKFGLVHDLFQEFKRDIYKDLQKTDVIYFSNNLQKWILKQIENNSNIHETKSTNQKSNTLHKTENYLLNTSVSNLSFIGVEYTLYLDSLLEWSFFSPKLCNIELFQYAAVILIESLIASSSEMTLSQIITFISIMYSGYAENPYHNFNHSIDTSQSTFYILNVLQVFKIERFKYTPTNIKNDTLSTGILRPIDGMNLIIASFGHDLGHPGLTNKFLAETNTSLNNIYNGTSTLENLHSAYLSVALEIISTTQVNHNNSLMNQILVGNPSLENHVENKLHTDFTKHHPLEEYKEKCIENYEIVFDVNNHTSNGNFDKIIKCEHNLFKKRKSVPEPSFATDLKHKKCISNSILATDMENHFDYIKQCENLKTYLSNNGNNPIPELEMETKRQVLCSILLKCSDISNISRPFNISQVWSVGLLNENKKQIEAEDLLGIQNTIRKCKILELPKPQVFFYTNYALPLFSSAANLLPQLHFLVEEVERNLDKWTYLSKKLESTELKNNNFVGAIDFNKFYHESLSSENQNMEDYQRIETKIHTNHQSKNSEFTTFEKKCSSCGKADFGNIRNINYMCELTNNTKSLVLDPTTNTLTLL